MYVPSGMQIRRMVNVGCTSVTDRRQTTDHAMEKWVSIAKIAWTRTILSKNLTNSNKLLTQTYKHNVNVTKQNIHSHTQTLTQNLTKNLTWAPIKTSSQERDRAYSTAPRTHTCLLQLQSLQTVNLCQHFSFPALDIIQDPDSDLNPNSTNCHQDFITCCLLILQHPTPVEISTRYVHNFLSNLAEKRTHTDQNLIPNFRQS